MELGSILLILAFTSAALSLCLFLLLIINNQHKNRLLVAEVAESLLYLSFSLALAALLILVYYFLTDNFIISYVYFNSDKFMPAIYKLSASWAGKEGSLLLWSVLSLMITSLFTATSGKDFKSLKTSAMLVLTSIFVLGITLFVSNPFVMLPFQPSDGVGMNPLLRTIEMIFHPPVVFLGYSLAAVPFALYFTGSRNRIAMWIKLTWITLTLGILLGCWWAYKTLGWGGFWGWDPVENASLLPWLSLTAYFHAKGRMREIFAYSAYILVIFAAFVTRSGIIKSVHAFTYEITGWVYLAFLLFFAILASIKLAMDRKNTEPAGQTDLTKSKSAKFKFYAIFLFTGAIITVLLGTATSVFVSVDRMYYTITFTPLFAAITVLIIFYITKIRKMARMTLITHLGVILLFIGAIAVWNFETRYENIILSPQAEVDGFSIKLLNVSISEDPEKFTVITSIRLENVGEVYPKLYVYKIERDQRVVSGVELLSLPWMDYYIALREVSNDFSYAVIDLYLVPLILLVWIGSTMMLAGSTRFR
jgi:cytochrome c-type biogenesis protein CcmF